PTVVLEFYDTVQIVAVFQPQIGGQDDMEAGLRQAAVRVIDLNAFIVSHAFVARAAGIDGDVGGGDEHFIHVRHVVLVAVLAPHGVEGGGAGGSKGGTVLEDHVRQIGPCAVGQAGDVGLGPA